MCIVSAVHDSYQKAIPSQDSWPLNPSAPRTLTDAEIRRVIDAYRKSLELAQTVDEITNQPDCEDPEKAKLLERVEAIEKSLDEIKKRFDPLS